MTLMNVEESYAKGFDCGFNASYIVGVQDGYAKGYDDANKIAIKERWT
jgi:hypothetical protein